MHAPWQNTDNVKTRTHLLMLWHMHRIENKYLFKLFMRMYQTCHWTGNYTCWQCFYHWSNLQCNGAAFRKVSYWVTLSYVVFAHNQFYSTELKINTWQCYMGTQTTQASQWLWGFGGSHTEAVLIFHWKVNSKCSTNEQFNLNNYLFKNILREENLNQDYNYTTNKIHLICETHTDPGNKDITGSLQFPSSNSTEPC